MTLIDSSPPAFRNSIGIPSQPGAFLLDICRIAYCTSISNTSGSSSYKFSLKISFILGYFLYRFSVYCCHLFFISFYSVYTLPVLSFIAPQLELRYTVIFFISLNRYLVLPILLLSSICLHLNMILSLYPALLSSGRLRLDFYILHIFLYFAFPFALVQFLKLHQIAIWELSFF